MLLDIVNNFSAAWVGSLIFFGGKLIDSPLSAQESRDYFCLAIEQFEQPEINKYAIR